MQIYLWLSANSPWILGSLWLLNEGLSNVPNGPNSPLHGIISGVLSLLNWIAGAFGKGNQTPPAA